ncbi:CBM21 domain-containing protein [Arthrobacter sp. NicSoilB8]|uniref:CBM21 domain-containing protein n=1 Tax=Arthrobacter sp. NicSoilB8 TaxID=2830998 RepID=UPI001CC460F4|nr:CBM21 domain-containing protein [Arthrobacter sp. NicSoilB8]BCW72427.1 hypothetical protein NicSoilB8_34710 [Arthrobacter sp. NicSoilB8]
MSYTYAIAKVANLGYDKKVLLHYREGFGPWKQHQLSWIEWHGDHDIFTTGTPNTSPPSADEFALSYTVNGTTYWDSQYGQNYKTGALNTITGGHIALFGATTRFAGLAANQRDVTGDIYVDNLSPYKDVGIRMSTDGGTAWQDVPAHYVGTSIEQAYNNLGIVEKWQFITPDFTGLQPVRFAAYYRDHSSGNTYWDNNFGNDYVLSPQPNSRIR